MAEKKEGCKTKIKKSSWGTKARTLGPVPNLEEHVRSDWWRGIFNSLYLKTDADVVDDNDITKKEVDIIVDTIGLKTDAVVLDLCCGQGRHTLELARRGFTNVEGFDRSHYLIQRAKEKSKKENIEVKLKEGDARKLPYRSDKFDVVLILGNSFGYFENLQDDLRVLKEVIRVLKPWGKLLIDITDGEYIKQNFEKRSWEWINNKLFVCRERSLSHDSDRLVSREVITHVEKGILADQFYAERLYSNESIENLLSQAGFSDVLFPLRVSSDSKRAQDLGMMALRLIVTAQVKKEWTPIKKRNKSQEKSVVVLLGDHTKPDPLKPDNKFDDDDFYTIDQMKSALKKHEGYNFTFLSNHDTIINDLTKLKCKIDYVFNLCDEGYFNDPQKELHIPALLDFIGIPYTGSGPQCLAFCYDKSLVRGVAKEMGIPVPDAMLLKSDDITVDLTIQFPVLVKPNFGDSSFGITQRSVAYNPEQLFDAISEIRGKFGYEKPILVEELLTGKDLTIGIIGNFPGNYIVLPPTEEDYSMLPPELPKICGYEAKWRPDSPYWQIKSRKAELPESTEKAIAEWSLNLSERLGCKDYVRLDWRLDGKGTPKLLEVNPNPGWCWDGHLAKMCAYVGMSYADMLAAILKSAEDRIQLVPKSVEALALAACAAKE